MGQWVPSKCPLAWEKFVKCWLGVWHCYPNWRLLRKLALFAAAAGGTSWAAAAVLVSSDVLIRRRWIVI